MEPIDRVAEIRSAIESGYRVFVIRGAAGTGKTTLVKRLAPMIKSIGKSFRLMAPTGRAALVLHNRTGYNASTIHAGIFQIVNEPVKDASGMMLKWIFPLKKDKDVENVAFIIYESSMVGFATHDNDRELLQFGSGSLLGDFVRYSGINVPNTTNLIFFVGDRFQLPPVGEECEIPPALDIDKLKEVTGMTPYIVELTQVHRQTAGSGILDEATKLRMALENRDYNYFRLGKHSDVTFETPKNTFDSWNALENLKDKIIIAQTNVRVREYNDEIRARLKLLGSMPTSGERLLSIRNTSIYSEDRFFPIYNGDFLHIESVSEEQCRTIVGFYRPKGTDETYRFEYFFKRMTFRWEYEPERGVASDVWVNITPIVNPDWDLHDNYASMGLYNAVKDNIEEMIRKKHPDYRIDRSKKEYWDTLLRNRIQDSVFLHAPIVKFGYAVTGHKSQGGEWPEVWADYAYGSNLHSSYFFRWAYTVTTRAKKHLHVINPPRVDSVGEVFKGAGDCVMADTVDRTVNQATLSPIGFSKKMEAAGFYVTQIEDRPGQYRCRVFVEEVPTKALGWIDFVYKASKIISKVEVHDISMPDWIQDYKGHPIADVTGENITLPDGVNIGDNLTSDIKRGVVARIRAALEKCDF